jgi:hypothetical protein
MERLRDVPLTASVRLDAALDRSSFHSTGLSRKDRFAAAAASTWAVLYLAGSPWIEHHKGGDWKDGLRLLTEVQNQHSFRYSPAIAHVFESIPSSQHPPDPQGWSSAEVEEIRVGIIRNRTLFALGILLIELCLNAPIAKLRQECYAGSLSASLGIAAAPLDDYEVANTCMQRVYLEAGDLYGYAVQRCLRCEFPGRDVTKSFEFEQFRSDFFHGVVAPVQATYNLLQALHDVLQPSL